MNGIVKNKAEQIERMSERMLKKREVDSKRTDDGTSRVTVGQRRASWILKGVAVN